MSETLHELAGAKAALTRAAPVVAALPDDELTASIVLVEEISRRLDVIKAQAAAELARRSRRELGDAGLAARNGHLVPESLLRALTRSSYQESARRIRVGTLLTEPAEFEAFAHAVARGDVGIEAADRVIRTLAPVVDQIEPEQLARATDALAGGAVTRNVDELGAMARDFRDRLDRQGVANRERHLHAQRSLRRGPVVDGLRRVSLVLDPESDVILIGAIDAAMSPRLGGPRFTAATDRSRAKDLLEDERSNEQLALDILVDLVRLGVERDDGRILGSTRPALRVTIAYEDLIRGVGDEDDETPETGIAWLEGSMEPLSAATARRILCDAGALPVVLSGAGLPLDLGRTRRLFTTAQRVALANRDGGCRWPGCDRPPSWCEAHHVLPCSSGGRTDVDNGLLLCRRHHLLLHNYGWRIERRSPAEEFVLVPPASVDVTRTPRPMPSKLPPWLNAKAG
ncbi:MAG TPA: DUF222 domain-containing protein [Lacisediminihabitans sp.]|uniref:HNH endonuclease signature motif containing protein n=1 Tax=Lacisediminihabitans sp. TaxID=2787631 RepID=UPI002ED9DBB4